MMKYSWFFPPWWWMQVVGSFVLISIIYTVNLPT